MTDRPAHLSAEFASQFADPSVVRAYRARPPYPAGTVEILESLLAPGPARVLELGCGTGDLTLALAPRVAALDALDPSRPMLEVARARAGSAHPQVRWHAAPAERFEPDESYALAVAAESLHWMEWSVVLPRVARWLRPGAVLAIVARELAPLPWDGELRRLIATHSTNRGFRPYDLIEELASRGLFRELGRRRTPPEPVVQSLADYVESFHSRNGFSRERMTERAAAEFDASLRTAVLSHTPDGLVRGTGSALVVWGAPASA
ncbi:MAG TPA: methyltransferase domain-containing protein [Myxococcota bacterium]|nr:methyltransferase domain-containing protein [Myxococcota bacterium]